MIRLCLGGVDGHRVLLVVTTHAAVATSLIPSSLARATLPTRRPHQRTASRLNSAVYRSEFGAEERLNSQSLLSHHPASAMAEWESGWVYLDGCVLSSLFYLKYIKLRGCKPSFGVTKSPELMIRQVIAIRMRVRGMRWRFGAVMFELMIRTDERMTTN
jgi:hypothetical protein